MERLTTTDEKLGIEMMCKHEDCWTDEEHCPRINKENCQCLETALLELKKYQDTGLTPEQVRKLKEEPRWIPVTERMPVESKENPVFENKELELYLVSVKNQDYAFRAFWNGKSFTDGWSKLDVIAWMPLPEPYKQEEGYA